MRMGKVRDSGRACLKRRRGVWGECRGWIGAEPVDERLQNGEEVWAEAFDSELSLAMQHRLKLLDRPPTHLIFFQKVHVDGHLLHESPAHVVLTLYARMRRGDGALHALSKPIPLE